MDDGVVFTLQAGNVRNRFRVAREALEDLDEVESLAEDQRVAAYERHKARIFDVAGRFMAGQRPDVVPLGTALF
jgi:hypothetical protein